MKSKRPVEIDIIIEESKQHTGRYDYGFYGGGDDNLPPEWGFSLWRGSEEGSYDALVIKNEKNEKLGHFSTHKEALVASIDFLKDATSEGDGYIRDILKAMLSGLQINKKSKNKTKGKNGKQKY